MNKVTAAESIQSFRFQPEQWLWCFHCERFFQGRDAQPDRVGGVQGCAFPDCGGAGYGVDILDWDTWPSQNQDCRVRWPRHEQLFKGLWAPSSTEEEEALYDPWHDPYPEPGFVRNTDLARRDAILAVHCREYAHDQGLFSGLDLCGLAALLRERFVATWDRDGRGAPVEECVTVLSRFPEITVGGRVVSATRTGSTLVFDYLECALAGLSFERRDAVIMAIATSCIEGGNWEEWEARAVGWWEERRIG